MENKLASSQSNYYEPKKHNNHQLTSFSLITDTLQEFGEEDLFDDNAFREDDMFCLGIIL